MKRLPTSLVALVLAGGLLFDLAACRQKEGEPCQTTTDCKKGLVCCFDGTNASSTLGVCMAETSCTPRLDAAPPDTGIDAAPPDADLDAAPPDAAVGEDVETTPDASVTLDASP